MFPVKRDQNVNYFFHSGEWPSKQIDFNDRRYLILKGGSCGITEVKVRKSLKDLGSLKT